MQQATYRSTGATTSGRSSHFCRPLRLATSLAGELIALVGLAGTVATVLLLAVVLAP